MTTLHSILQALRIIAFFALPLVLIEIYRARDEILKVLYLALYTALCLYVTLVAVAVITGS